MIKIIIVSKLVVLLYEDFIGKKDKIIIKKKKREKHRPLKDYKII
jgi:hypothetical protein